MSDQQHEEFAYDTERKLRARIEALEAQLAKATEIVEASGRKRGGLEAKLEKAVGEKLDAISTLDAWFDRRKLGHDAVDQAVIDAASGYLRTSRCGGMASEESDMILGVIQDMAHLGLFADLFARATLAATKGKADE
jgi:hypothetical protein